MPAAAPARATEPLDELTLRRAQRGDEQAWRGLIARYQQPVHRVAVLETEITSLRQVLDDKERRTKQLEDRLATIEQTPDEDPTLTAPLPDSLDRVMITTVISTIKDEILGCGGGYTGTLKAMVKVAPSGKVSTVSMSPGRTAPDGCVRRLLAAAEFAPTRNGGSFSYPFVFSGCDADALAARGSEAFGSSQYAVAIASFEAAYRCRADAGFALRVVLAACRSKNAEKATAYWRRLSPAQQTSVQGVCHGNGITAAQLDGAR